jgi:putative phosphoribosyl transferase
MQVFEDRRDAGRKLAATLAEHPRVTGAERLVVLGVPRGGLPVGAEVARTLGAAFDVVVVRKLRCPANPELGFGAVGAGGFVQIDDATVERLGITEDEVAAEIADRTEAVERRLAVYREVAPPVDLADAVVIVVDDGIANGGTARQACEYARRGGAEAVVLAVPVAPENTAERLAGVTDEVIVLSSPAEFIAVGQAYSDFSPLSDDDAVAALRHANAAT